MVMVVNSAVAMAGLAAKANAGATHSGLQKQVLALYKRALRAAQQKDRELAAAATTTAGPATGSTTGPATGPAATTTTTASLQNDARDTFVYVRERFRDDAASVRRTDFNVIEHLLRKGDRDLKMLARMKAAHFAHVPRSGGDAPQQ